LARDIIDIRSIFYRYVSPIPTNNSPELGFFQKLQAQAYFLVSYAGTFPESPPSGQDKSRFSLSKVSCKVAFADLAVFDHEHYGYCHSIFLVSSWRDSRGGNTRTLIDAVAVSPVHPTPINKHIRLFLLMSSVNMS